MADIAPEQKLLLHFFVITLHGYLQNPGKQYHFRGADCIVRPVQLAGLKNGNRQSAIPAHGTPYTLRGYVRGGYRAAGLYVPSPAGRI